MSDQERKNLLFILIAILVFIYLFMDYSENFETYRYRCGDKFKYKKTSSAEGKCHPTCPARVIDRNSAGTYEFKCIYNEKAANAYYAKKREERRKAEEAEAARKKAEEAEAARKKAEEYKKISEAIIKKANEEAAIKKAKEARIKAEEEMVRNMQYKPMIAQEY